MKNNKALSSVVATSLFLVLVTLSVISFQNWFLDFSSKTQSEIETRDSIGSFSIETIHRGNLYVKGIAEIQSIKVNDNDCFVSGRTIEGINNLPMSNCAQNGKNEIVVVTNDGVLSKTVYLNNYNYSDPCPVGYVLVPGNIQFETKNFCVMKYEAKATTESEPNLYISASHIMFCGDSESDLVNCSTDGSVNVTSKAVSQPLANINQVEARQLCSNLGKNYHLITNNEWMTIARNIEREPTNWANGTVGSSVTYGGGLKRGNTAINDSISYDGANPENGTSRDEKALLNLSNGVGIWDLSGNLNEWINETFNSNLLSSFGQLTTTTYEWTLITGYENFRSSDLSYNRYNGIGRVVADIDDANPSGTVHAIHRGGYYGNGANAGIYAIDTINSPYFSSQFITFRCTYSL